MIENVELKDTEKIIVSMEKPLTKNQLNYAAALIDAGFRLVGVAKDNSTIVYYNDALLKLSKNNNKLNPFRVVGRELNTEEALEVLMDSVKKFPVKIEHSHLLDECDKLLKINAGTKKDITIAMVPYLKREVERQEAEAKAETEFSR